jgi:hypothetical protein
MAERSPRNFAHLNRTNTSNTSSSIPAPFGVNSNLGSPRGSIRPSPENFHINLNLDPSNAGSNFFSALVSGDRSSAEDTSSTTRNRLWNRYLNSIQPSTNSSGPAQQQQQHQQDILSSNDIIQQQAQSTGTVARSHYDEDDDAIGISTDFHDWHLLSVPSESLLLKRAQVEESAESMDGSLNIDQSFVILNQIESLEKRLLAFSELGEDALSQEAVSKEILEAMEAIDHLHEEMKYVFKGKRVKSAGSETALAEQVRILEKQLAGGLTDLNAFLPPNCRSDSMNNPQKYLEDHATTLESQIQQISRDTQSYVYGIQMYRG